MAGGLGSRLDPVTKVVNKHLMPIFDKPLIYYPLSTLMLAGIREVMIISGEKQIQSFKELLGTGSDLGISIEYEIQREPNGIAEGLLIASDFLLGHKVALILGDNLFHGEGLGRQLSKFQLVEGAQIFAYEVANPTDFGVVELDSQGRILNIVEKPKLPKSNLAVTGLYFYDENASTLVRGLKPSHRNELEITDLNNLYLKERNLNLTILSRGTAWLDTGTFAGLHDASSYIRILQERQNSSIGNPMDVALNQGWLN